jgi:hypothetical protein
VTCGRDLAAAGFIAFSIEYRLAPNGGLLDQVSNGQFPDQSDDVKMAVLAARHDARCNGQGRFRRRFGRGLPHGLCGRDRDAREDRIDVGVCLSGAYDLSDFSPDPEIATFIDDVTNYINVTTTDVAALRAASPAYLADRETAPLFLMHTDEDPMPYSQLGDMTSHLAALGLTNFQSLTLPGSAHSFANWPAVKDYSIIFLTSWFAGVPPPGPTPSPQPSPTPTPEATVVPTPPPVVGPSPTRLLLNVSTRVGVESGSSVMIGGFIVTGNVAKKVALRAIGPSLADVGVANVLTDPVLELYNASGRLIAQNDNWSSLPSGSDPGRSRAEERERILHRGYLGAWQLHCGPSRSERRCRRWSVRTFRSGSRQLAH